MIVYDTVGDNGARSRNVFCHHNSCKNPPDPTKKDQPISRRHFNEL